LSKVLWALGRSGLVHAQRGKNGGFTLTAPAAELSILDAQPEFDLLGRGRAQGQVGENLRTLR